MAMGKHQGNGIKTVWFELHGKTGELTVWNKAEQREEAFGFVAGVLTDVRVKERNFGSNKGYVVTLTLKDDQAKERYVIETGAGTRVTTRLLGQINAVEDLSQPIYVAPYLMKQGDQLQNGETVNQDTVMTSVKMVLGYDGERLELSDGVRPFYGEPYGDKLPAPQPVMNNGKPVMQNGQQVMDRSEIEGLCAALVQGLSERLHPTQDQPEQNGEGAGDGIDPGEALAAAGAADRSAMRARA